MIHRFAVSALAPILAILPSSPRVQAESAAWRGFADISERLGTADFPFDGDHPEAVTSNKNYYDGDFADFDGDGLPDRALGSRYGLLKNLGGGRMTHFAGRTGFLLREMPGAGGWGEDAFQWADVDGDGDYDVFSGGNGEPLVLQANEEGWFRTRWIEREGPHSVLNFVNTDLETDGDVDLVTAHAFCADRPCGGPAAFAVWVNDGKGRFRDEARTRGLAFDGGGHLITGVVSGDVDGDGDFDLVIGHGMDGDRARHSVLVATNDGTGRFETREFPLSPPGSGFGQGMNLGDIDADGDLDLVLCHADRGGRRGHPVVAHVVAANDGDGNFADESRDRFVGSYPLPAARYAGENGKLVDVDYDGDLDLVSHAKPDGYLTIFTNDGGGRFAYDAAHSMRFERPTDGLGADVDVTDLDGDGDYDIWVGVAGATVHILENLHEPADGLPADQPRSLAAVALEDQGIRLSWSRPAFAANARYYRVYRALAPELARRDRTLIGLVGQPHQDEGFAAPLVDNTIEFVDRAAAPGIVYHYSVTHVGTENTESAPAPEVDAVLARPRAATADRTPPTIEIKSPERLEWSVLPRIAVAFADGESGVDPESLEVAFEGGSALDVGGLALRLDANLAILQLVPGMELASERLATLVVRLRDRAGNGAEARRAFYPEVVPDGSPTAAIEVVGTDGLRVELSADGSLAKDRVLSVEWSFGDGRTAGGSRVSHEFESQGEYEVRVFVRDNRGGVGVNRLRIAVREEGD